MKGNAMDCLRRDFLVRDLSEATLNCAIDGTIVVQARQRIEETAWLCTLADQDALILGVVGWVPLTSPDLESVLDRLAHPKLKAVRHVLHDEPDDLYVARPDFNRGISMLRDRNLTYDILVFERHLPQTIRFVDRHPNQLFVVDHVAKPRIRNGVLSPWKENLTELARRDNVYCKISGMVTEADHRLWTPAQLEPYFDTALKSFGPSRLMFGSDWPVLTLASSYRDWVRTFHSFVAALTPDEQLQIGSETARAAYRL
jgi:L-fuconolactonase